MTAEQMEKAIVEIGLGKTFEESEIKPKSQENLRIWESLEADYKLAEENNWTIEIPSEMP